MHARVDGAERARRGLGRRRVAVDDAEHGVHRAPQAMQRMRQEVAVSGDARRDERMRELEEERALAAEEQHRLAVHAPKDAVPREETVVQGTPSAARDVTHRAA
jgi:hypothetical protein